MEFVLSDPSALKWLKTTLILGWLWNWGTKLGSACSETPREMG